MSHAAVAAAAQPRPPRLVLRFTVATAAAFALAGAATLWYAQRSAVHRSEDTVSFHTRFVADTILRDRMRPSDFSHPARGARLVWLDRLFRHEVLTKGVLRVKLYGPGARVVYSNDHTLIGTVPGEHEDIEAALQGKGSRDVTRLNHEGGTGPNKKVLEVYTPVRMGHRIPGVFEIYQDYAPVAKSVRDEVVPLAAILGGALVFLVIVLLPILRRTTAALVRSLGEQRRSQEALESTEHQLRQAQKMEAIGQLAGGMAHDFNNLLLAIRGYSELALTSLTDPERAREDIDQIQAATDRASAITRRLLAFSRQQVLDPTVFDLSEAVAELEPMLARLLGEQVEIHTSLEPALVLADRTQIEQVLVNLAINARDAMPDGGILTLETRRTGSGAIVAVRDSGYGMDADTLSHLFEPFFTTKDEGTGLGLAMVYGIVTQSGGAIAVESELGCGTEFRISLPPAEREAADSGEKPLVTAERR